MCLNRCHPLTRLTGSCLGHGFEWFEFIFRSDGQHCDQPPIRMYTILSEFDIQLQLDRLFQVRKALAESLDCCRDEEMFIFRDCS